MYQLFREKYPTAKCSYESYRKIFNNRFNVSFGYPRKDTCSECDKRSAKIHGETDEAIKQQLNLQQQAHLSAAEVFYSRKKARRAEAGRFASRMVVAFDFWKNLSVPNITTNDVYYRRQLSVYSFNVHVLHSNEVFVYCYDETIARKGSDDVCSMLNNFLSTHVPENVTQVQLFCDGCAGQNKNWTLIRYLYYLVHIARRFRTVSVSFPIVGHSYMECDKNMAHVNQKSKVEVPGEWCSVFEAARKKPSPLHVIKITNDSF